VCAGGSILGVTCCCEPPCFNVDGALPWRLPASPVLLPGSLPTVYTHLPHPQAMPPPAVLTPTWPVFPSSGVDPCPPLMPSGQHERGFPHVAARSGSVPRRPLQPGWGQQQRQPGPASGWPGSSSGAALRMPAGCMASLRQQPLKLGVAPSLGPANPHRLQAIQLASACFICRRVASRHSSGIRHRQAPRLSPRWLGAACRHSC